MKKMIILIIAAVLAVLVLSCQNESVPGGQLADTPKLVKPVFSIGGGLHNNDLTIALSSSEKDAEIRYTTDGSVPTKSSPVYKTPVAINGNGTVVKLSAMAFADGKKSSDVASESYCIRYPVHKRISYSSGDDGQYGTADDVIRGYRHYGHDSDGRMIIYADRNGKGADGDWLTDDDTVRMFYIFKYDQNGRMIESRNYYPIAGDTELIVSDDRLRGLERYSYSSDGLQRKCLFYKEGPDGTWNTEDDVISQYSIEIFSSEGVSIWYKSYDFGGDDTPYTDDDYISYLLGYENDSFGVRKKRIFYSAGDDGKLGTSDDVASTYFAYELTGDASFEHVRYYSSGPDGKCFSSDDNITSYHRNLFGLNEYDISGLKWEGY